jgi:predicted RNA-binding protein
MIIRKKVINNIAFKVGRSLDELNEFLKKYNFIAIKDTNSIYEIYDEHYYTIFTNLYNNKMFVRNVKFEDYIIIEKNNNGLLFLDVFEDKNELLKFYDIVEDNFFDIENVKIGSINKEDEIYSFIYIDNIHNKENINIIIDYMKKTKDLDYDFFYDKDSTKIYFICKTYKDQCFNDKYSFYLSNDHYVLIGYDYYCYTFKTVNSKIFKEKYI